MTMRKEELGEIVVSHGEWLQCDGGKRADLSYADLRDAFLCGVSLREPNLPIGVYQIVGPGSCNRCTTYNSGNDRVTCGCWDDKKGNHLDSFITRIESMYGPNGKDPNPKYYTEYMSAISFFKAMKELNGV